MVLLLELMPILLVNNINDISSTIQKWGQASGAYAYLIPTLGGREVIYETPGSRKYCQTSMTQNPGFNLNHLMDINVFFLNQNV